MKTVTQLQDICGIGKKNLNQKNIKILPEKLQKCYLIFLKAEMQLVSHKIK